MAKVNYERLATFSPERLLALERQAYEAIQREEEARRRRIEEERAKKRKSKKKRKK